MSSTAPQAASTSQPVARRTWRTAAGLSAMAGGAIIVTGAFLPWVETFAGLIGIPGVRGGNGRILAAAGALIAAAGLWHVCRGGSRSQWLAGLGGFAALGFSAYLLIQLTATLRTLGGNSMVLARGGPGLWVCAGGSLLAFTTLFLPTSAQAPPAPLARATRIGRRLLACTADLDSRGARRGLQIALGGVWLLDAILQLQPSMFGPRFVGMLAGTATGNPAVISGPILWTSHLVARDPVPWNTAFALTQLAIAAGLLWRPTVKAALAGSIAWAAAVWWLGEGLGGLLTGTATPVTGAPGAVILYALVAVLAWPARYGEPRYGGVAAASLLGSRGSKAAWLVLWAGFAYLLLQPEVRAPGSLHNAIAGDATGEPGWLTGPDRSIASAIGAHGTVTCVMLAAAFALIAAGILLPATIRPALVLAVAASVVIWVIGENFGQIFTSMGTDPSTGPLLLLLAAAYWPPRPAAAQPVAMPLAAAAAAHDGPGSQAA